MDGESWSSHRKSEPSCLLSPIFLSPLILANTPQHKPLFTLLSLEGTDLALSNHLANWLPILEFVAIPRRKLSIKKTMPWSMIPAAIPQANVYVELISLHFSVFVFSSMGKVALRNMIRIPSTCGQDAMHFEQRTQARVDVFLPKDRNRSCLESDNNCLLFLDLDDDLYVRAWLCIRLPPTVVFIPFFRWSSNYASYSHCQCHPVDLVLVSALAAIRFSTHIVGTRLDVRMHLHQHLFLLICLSLRL